MQEEARSGELLRGPLCDQPGYAFVILVLETPARRALSPLVTGALSITDFTFVGATAQREAMRPRRTRTSSVARPSPWPLITFLSHCSWFSQACACPEILLRPQSAVCECDLGHSSSALKQTPTSASRHTWPLSLCSPVPRPLEGNAVHTAVTSPRSALMSPRWIPRDRRHEVLPSNVSHLPSKRKPGACRGETGEFHKDEVSFSEKKSCRMKTESKSCCPTQASNLCLCSMEARCPEP